MRRQRKKRRVVRRLLCILIILIISISVFNYYQYTNTNILIRNFANQNELSVEQWPDELIELMDKNPDTKTFVLNYPLKKNYKSESDLTEYYNCDEVPLLFQWDERWGYTKYAGELMGLSGCGPTCLSMVCIYLLNDTSYTPLYIAEFAEDNDYSISGNGSSWTLISSGGKQLGLDIIEIPLDENRIVKNLEVGNPIICVMGPGYFTTTGHFIVITDYIDGKIKVNDPNSSKRSQKFWELSDVMPQIRNLWVCRA